MAQLTTFSWSERSVAGLGFAGPLAAPVPDGAVSPPVPQAASAVSPAAPSSTEAAGQPGLDEGADAGVDGVGEGVASGVPPAGGLGRRAQRPM